MIIFLKLLKLSSGYFCTKKQWCSEAIGWIWARSEMRNLHNCSDWAKINSLLRNTCVLMLLVESERDLRWEIFIIAQIELRLNLFWCYWLNLSEIWDNWFFKLLRLSSDYFCTKKHMCSEATGWIWARSEMWNFYNCSDWAEINSLLRNTCVLKLWLNVSEIWYNYFFKLLRVSWD